MFVVGDKVSHRFHPLYRNSVGEVISLEGHWFDGEQMIVVKWQGKEHDNYPAEHHYAESLRVEA